MRSKKPSQSFKRQMKELEKISTRIEAKMAKLEKIIDNLSESLS